MNSVIHLIVTFKRFHQPQYPSVDLNRPRVAEDALSSTKQREQQVCCSVLHLYSLTLSGHVRTLHVLSQRTLGAFYASATMLGTGLSGICILHVCEHTLNLSSITSAYAKVDGEIDL